MSANLENFFKEDRKKFWSEFNHEAWDCPDPMNPDYAELRARVERLIESNEEMQVNWEDMKAFILSYFDNLSVQNEINKKLDQMLIAGDFDKYIGNARLFVDPEAMQNNSFNVKTSDLQIEPAEHKAESLFETVEGQPVPSDGFIAATFNLGYGSEFRDIFSPEFIPAKRRIIADSHATIVGLQEVSSTIYYPQTDFLTNTRLKYTTEAGIYPDVYPFTNFGLGALCNESLEDTTFTEYSRQGNEVSYAPNRDGFIHKEVKQAGRTVSFYNTHMWYKAMTSDENFAIWQAQAQDLIKALKADPAIYKIVTGDFNIRQNPGQAHSDAMQVFVDAGFKLANGGKYPTLWAGYAVDDIIYTPNLTVEAAHDISYRDRGDHSLFWAKFKF